MNIEGLISLHPVLSPFVGAALVALSGAFLLLANGELPGTAAVLGELFSRPGTATRFTISLSFFAGLFAGGLVLASIAPSTLSPILGRSDAIIVLGGLVGGFGARLAAGSFTEHALFGNARCGQRPLAATAAMMFAAVGTATVLGMGR